MQATGPLSVLQAVQGPLLGSVYHPLGLRHRIWEAAGRGTEVRPGQCAVWLGGASGPAVFTVRDSSGPTMGVWAGGRG